MHYAEFAEDEVSSFVRLTAIFVIAALWTDVSQSAALAQAIKDYDNNKWKVIGHKVGKPAKVGREWSCKSAVAILTVNVYGATRLTGGRRANSLQRSKAGRSSAAAECAYHASMCSA